MRRRRLHRGPVRDQPRRSTDPALADAAKVGILFGSAVAGIVGYTLLRTAPAAAVPETDDADADGAATATPDPVVPGLDTAGAA